MARGKFITLEGGEGSGKSTQARRLTERLTNSGLRVALTREPGGTALGEQVREIILTGQPTRDAEFLLFAAARAEHVAARIAPALGDGLWVVCDRYLDSTRVYQGALAGIDRLFLETVERHTVAGAWPDLTIVLDIDAEVGRARASARGTLNRYDAEHLDYHRRIRMGFLEIAAAEPERCIVVDAGRDIEAVTADVWRAVALRLAVTAE